LKSWNLESLIRSGPLPGVTREPFSTFQIVGVFALSILHPARSFPSKSCIGFSHVGAPSLFSDGALTPVHVQGVPSGPVVVPVRCLPLSVPSKTISSLRSSSSLGETNFKCPLATSTIGSGRAFPQRLTLIAFGWPCPRRSSGQ